MSVVITSFRRAWALSYSLSSLVDQNRCPDEVIIVLKPSGDGSEQIIEKFSRKLPIKTVIQDKGFVPEAIELGIKNSSGDLILFMDDDAVADRNFVARYFEFFEDFEDAGGATGVIFTAYLNNGYLVKTLKPFYPSDIARRTSYRKPLKVMENYFGWVSKSGLSTTTRAYNDNVTLNALLCGANMGLRREAVVGCPLNELYMKSKKGFNYESLLAYYTRLKGFNTYKLMNPINAPIVWHIAHKDSLTRKTGFWDEFWLSYDVFENYFRYKKLGADVSFLSWVKACIVLLRRHTPARILALLYTVLDPANFSHCLEIFA